MLDYLYNKIQINKNLHLSYHKHNEQRYHLYYFQNFELDNLLLKKKYGIPTLRNPGINDSTWLPVPPPSCSRNSPLATSLCTQLGKFGQRLCS